MLSSENNISKSRLIKNYLQENPKVILELRQGMTQCSLCGKELGRGDVKVSTPRYGVICMGCWIEKHGEIVEESPLTNIRRK